MAADMSSGFDTPTELGLQNRSRRLIEQGRDETDCATLLLIFKNAVDAYKDFIARAEKGVSDPTEMGAETTLGRVGNAFAITQRRMGNNGCISSEEHNAINRLGVRDAVHDRQFDKARRLLDEALDIADVEDWLDERGVATTDRCANATAVAVETIIQECGGKQGEFEKVADEVFVFIPEGEDRPVNRLRDAVEDILE